jgi:hypothetical protein
MNADQIRKELSGLAQVRAGLEADLARVRADIAKVVKAADASEEITMTEAARLADLSRVTVYELLKS